MKTTYVTLKPDMARAYRDKLKWMTRRVMVPQPPDWAENSYVDDDRNVIVFDGKSRPDCVHYERSLKYGKHDDQLILGTTWSTLKNYDGLKPTDLEFGAPLWSYFDSNDKPDGYGKLRPGRFLPNKFRDQMPRETLKIVRAERVQDITEDDAWNEGIDMGEVMEIPCSGPLGVAVFSRLWNSINAERGYSWDSNPWVWVLGW
ncbi:MAG: hypothetical protein P8Y00_00255 [Deltaproteobacteria bacterium]